jgi:hypothetical protein
MAVEEHVTNEEEARAADAKAAGEPPNTVRNWWSHLT